MAITLVSNTAQGSSNQENVTTGAINTTGANLIVACAVWYPGSTAVGTFSDSKGNTWTPLTIAYNTYWACSLFYSVSPSVGTGHTFFFGGLATYPSLYVSAWSGVAASSPFDQQNTAAAFQPGSVTPSENGELIITGINDGDATTGTLSINSGFTISNALQGTVSVFQGGGMAYLVQTTAAAVNPTWSTTGSSGPASVIATFKSGSVSPDATVNATGVSATGAVGTVSVTASSPNATVNATGVSATGSVGTVTAYATGDILANLVSYWKMDEESGDAVDWHSTNDLTDNNAVGAATGKLNGGRDLEASSSQFFSHASNGDLQTGDIDFTFQAWVKPESVGSTMMILSKANSASSGQREYFLYYSNLAGFSFDVHNSATGSNTVNSFISATAGVWSLVHAWHDSVNNVIGMSVNAGTPITAATTITPFAGSATFFIGKRYTTGSLYFDGIVDEVGFWKRVLTSGDRAALYNADAGLPYPFTPAVNTTVNATGVSATGEVGIPNPTVPGSTRINYYAESLGNTTTTSVTYASKCSLTFTTEATTDYWILWGVRINPSVAPQGFVRLRDTTGAATLRGDIAFTAKDPTDLEVVWCIDKFTSVGAASQQFDIEVRGSTTSNCVFSHATIAVIKADAADQYAESEGDSNATVATLADKTTLTFTPGTTGDYLVLASALFQCSSATASGRLQLDKNSAASIYGDANRVSGTTTDIVQWNTMVKQTALSGSNTFKIRYANTAATGTTSFRQASILALRLDKFQVAQYAETRARGTTSSTTYVDKATFTFTPAAKSHLILGAGQVDGSSITVSAFVDLAKAGTALVENMHEARSTTVSANVHSFLWSKVETLAASSTAFAIQSKSETGALTTGLAEAAVAVLEYAAAGTNAGMVAAGVAATGQVGTVTVEVAAAPTVVNVTGVSATGQVGTVTVTVVGDATVNATGVSSTGQVGTVAPTGTASVSPTGVSATGEVGTVTVSLAASATASPTGVSATGQVGTVTPAAGASVTETGLSATGQVGTVTVTGTSSQTVTGVSTTGQIGTVAPSGSASVTETGLFATGQVGTASVSVTANPSVTVTGVAAIGQLGGVTVLAGGNVSVSPPGVAATGQVGTVTVTGTASVTETGVSATGQIGTVSVTGSASVTVTGLSATGQVGTASVTTLGNATVNVTGVMGTGQVGTVTVTVIANTTVFLTGVSTTGQIGTVTAFIGDVPPEEGIPTSGGIVGWSQRRKKRPQVIRYSEFSTQEAYAAALSQAAIPLTQVSMEPAAVTPEDDFEDDDDILFAIVKLYH